MKLFLGIPTAIPNRDDSSTFEVTRADGWMSSYWPFPAMPSVTNLFSDTDPMEIVIRSLKKRIDNLEKSQQSVLDKLKAMNAGN